MSRFRVAIYSADMFAWIEMAVLAAVLTALTPALGGYMASVFTGRRTVAHHVLTPLEALTYRACRINPAAEMTWGAYLGAVAVFTAISAAMLFLLLVTQASLPLN